MLMRRGHKRKETRAESMGRGQAMTPPARPEGPCCRHSTTTLPIVHVARAEMPAVDIQGHGEK